MTVKRPRTDRGPVWSPGRLKREREARRKRKGRRRPRKKPRPTRRHPPPTDLALLPAEAAEADRLADELGLLPIGGRLVATPLVPRPAVPGVKKTEKNHQHHSGEGGVKTQRAIQRNRLDSRAFLHTPPVHPRKVDT